MLTRDQIYDLLDEIKYDYDDVEDFDCRDYHVMRGLHTVCDDYDYYFGIALGLGIAELK